MTRFSRTSASPPALPSGAPKLAVLIVAAGVVAASLLVTRQQRIEAAHELTTLHRRMSTNERALWAMRAAIAERCRPEAVRLMLETRSTDWTSIPGRGPATPDAATPPAPAPPPAGASAARTSGASLGPNLGPQIGHPPDPEPEPGG